MRERHNSLRQRGMEKRSLRQWHSRPSDTLKNRKIYTRSASLLTSQKNPQGTAGRLRGQIVPEGKRTSERNNAGLTANYSQKSEENSNSQRRRHKKIGGLFYLGKDGNIQEERDRIRGRKSLLSLKAL